MNLIKNLGSRQVFSLFLIYLIANVTYLLNVDGLYWDDWVVYNQDYPTLALFFDMIKNTTHGYFAILMLNVGNGIYGFRLSLFVMYFFSGLYIIASLKSMRLFTEAGSYIVGILYLVSPVFHTKAAISIVPFYLPVFLFFFAFYWLSKEVGKLSWKSRLGILSLFFVSFTTGSLLVLYLLVLLYILYKQCFEGFEKKTFFRRFGRSIKQNIDFILLPMLFFWFKSVFLVPYGLYLNYNKVTLETINIAFSNIYLALESAFYWQLEFIIKMNWKEGLFVTVVVCVIVLMKRLPLKFEVPTFSSALVVFIVGVVGLVCAVFPYLAVNKFPVFTNWQARFLVLTILPMSLILYALIVLLAQVFVGKMKHFFIVGALSFLVSVFVVQGIEDQHRYNMDWFYRTGIEQQFLNSPVIASNTTFIVVNKVRKSMVYNWPVIYYDWSGMLKQVYGDDSRLMIRPAYLRHLPKMQNNKHFKQYNYSSWVPSKPIWVTVDYARTMTRPLIFKLYWARLFNEGEFNLLAKELVKISFGK